MNSASFEILIAIIGATIGALLGSLSSILFGLMASRRQERRDLVLQLYQEYNSPEMNQNRILASEFFEHRPAGVGYSEYSTAFSKPDVTQTKGVTREQFEAFRNLSVFFEKVYVYKTNRYLNKKLAASMLGIYLCGWARNGWLDFLKASDLDDFPMGVRIVDFGRVYSLPKSYVLQFLGTQPRRLRLLPPAAADSGVGGPRRLSRWRFTKRCTQ